MKILFTTLLLLTTVTLSHSAIVLTTFGNSDAPTFSTDAFNTIGTSQNASSITIDGNTTDLLSGTFPSIDISSEYTSGISLFGSVATNPAAAFQINLYDSSDRSATFNGGSWTDVTNSGSSTLSFLSETSGFDATDVIAMDLATGGSVTSVEATLTRLETVPEPTTGLLVVLGAGGLALLRRRRA